jgi:hypothetical protein
MFLRENYGWGVRQSSRGFRNVISETGNASLDNRTGSRGFNRKRYHIGKVYIKVTEGAVSITGG